MIDRTDEGHEIHPPGSGAGAGARRVKGPSWIGRNRGTLLALRRAAATVTMVAPPPARVPLALGCVAIEGVLLAEEMRRGTVPRERLAVRAVGLALEGGALAASAAWAPKALARNGARLAAARRIIARIEGRGGRPW